MNTAKNYTNSLVILDIVSIVMLCVPLFLLSAIVLDGTIAPILLYTLMITMGIVFIVFFSNKRELFIKVKLFILFFSFYLSYTLIQHYILLSLSPSMLPYNYLDENTLYMFSNFGVPFISGEKNFFDIFSVFKINELTLHVVFSSVIAYFSILIDGSNTIIIQKMLAPFFGGLLVVVLYSTLQRQFSDHSFALKATFAYGFFSAVCMYSTTLLRDVDVALAYMIFISLFLQKSSIVNFMLLFMVAFMTIYLRVESGMVLFGLILLYSYLYIRTIQSISIKLIFYILLMGLFSFVIGQMFQKVIGMVAYLNEANVTRSTAAASGGSFGVILNKLPFGISHTAKVLFGQLQSFPILMDIHMPAYAIGGIFWPFIFIMMLYAVMKKNIRIFMDEKVKYLLLVAISIFYLMSAEPATRRMLSVYPIIYMVSLYMFWVTPNSEVKRIFYYFLFGIISLNTFYYFLKV